MAVRTRSTGARAAIAAARIGQSERERLQRAVKDIESSISDYNKEVSRRKKRSGNWAILKKLGQGLTTLAQYGVTGPLSPYVAGFGLAMTGIGAQQERKEIKEYKKSAKRIDAGAADPLSKLLFVGQEAKDVARGAKDIRGQAISEGDLARQRATIQMALDIGGGIVGAGQAGTFDKFGDISGFLNKPLGGKYITDPGAGGTALEKLTYQTLQSKQPSVGSILGGATPFEQELGGQMYELGTQALNREYFRPSRKLPQGFNVGNLSDVAQNRQPVPDRTAQRPSLSSFLPDVSMPDFDFPGSVDTGYAKAQAEELAGGPYPDVDWSDYITQSDYAQRVAEATPITKEIAERTHPTISEWSKPHQWLRSQARDLRKGQITERIQKETGRHVPKANLSFMDYLKHYRPTRPFESYRAAKSIMPWDQLMALKPWTR